MNDKIDAVVEAARVVRDTLASAPSTLKKEMLEKLDSALDALDSPLPSDEQLRDVALDAFNKRRESILAGDYIEPAQEAARQAICAYTLRFAGNHCGACGDAAASEFFKLADEMEARSD